MTTILTAAQHRELDKEYRKCCTQQLGWNGAKRAECRKQTMCQECREIASRLLAKREGVE